MMRFDIGKVAQSETCIAAKVLQQTHGSEEYALNLSFSTFEMSDANIEEGLFNTCIAHCLSFSSASWRS